MIKPGTVQQAMDVIQSTVKWKSFLVYLEDIVIFTKKAKEQISNVKEVPALSRNAKVTLKRIKWCFFIDTINWLRNLIG